MSHPAELLFLFLVGHAIADFVMQPEAMVEGKSRRQFARAKHGPGFPPWTVWLSAHGLVHGGAVFLVSGLWELGAIETLLHAVIDHLKCEEHIGFYQDQALHLICKLGYLAFLVLQAP